MQLSTGVPAALVDVLTGLTLVFVLIGAVVVNYRLRRVSATDEPSDDGPSDDGPSDEGPVSEEGSLEDTATTEPAIEGTAKKERP